MCTIEQQREVWRIADEAGFDHLWDFDHFHPIGGAPLEGPIFDGWSLLAAMAEATKRVRLGNMVTGLTYRHPAVLAKIATTVDHLSGGRLEFGIGAAWAEVEHTMLGIDFPRVGERLRRLDEACRLIKQLWTEEQADFDGRYYRLQEAYAAPKPVQKPYPPIWIGGGGGQKTLRLLAGPAGGGNMAGGGGGGPGGGRAPGWGGRTGRGGGKAAMPWGGAGARWVPTWTPPPRRPPGRRGPRPAASWARRSRSWCAAPASAAAPRSPT